MTITFDASVTINKLEIASKEIISKFPELELSVLPPIAVAAEKIKIEIDRQLEQSHPVGRIISAGMEEQIIHLKAYEKLDEPRAAIVHARKISEIQVTLAYLVMHTEKFEEFEWRWENFNNLQILRSELLSGSGVSPDGNEWFLSIKSEFLNVFSGEFQGDFATDAKAWKKYNNWLWPISLKTMYLDSGRVEDYQTDAYHWGSQHTHFSPMVKLLHSLSDANITFSSAFKLGIWRDILDCFTVAKNLVTNKTQLENSHQSWISYYNMWVVKLMGPVVWERFVRQNSQLMETLAEVGKTPEPIIYN